MITNIEKYGARNWAVRTAAGELVAVTLYKKGARRISEILEMLPENISSPNVPRMKDVSRATSRVGKYD